VQIRSYSWGAATISWSGVIEELLRAAEQLGHRVDFLSTNGVEGMRHFDAHRIVASALNERSMIKLHTPYDLDLTFTVPNNYGERFLGKPKSKARFAITDYESFPAPANWVQWYGIPDLILPGSNWVADALVATGCPRDKLVVVPHGVDLDLFNPGILPHQIKTDKKFKFLCVAEPHYRKQLDLLIKTYCTTFTNQDDVCLVLKTKLFTAKDKPDGFEMDLKPVLASWVRKLGPAMPEIKIITSRLPNLGTLYTACDAFVLMTAAEGFGMPFLEALACGLIVIAPEYGGQLDFLTHQNSVLVPTGVRSARPQEQYWGQRPDSQVGKVDETAFGQAMLNVVKDQGTLKERLTPHMKSTAEDFTWAKAMGKIIGLAEQVGHK
jgi:glycosyltransferase involved in cell wall biosynthesis